MKTLMATDIYVTSCYSPASVYKNENIQECIGQLVRRCDKILAFLQNGDIVDHTDIIRESVGLKPIMNRE